MDKIDVVLAASKAISKEGSENGLHPVEDGNDTDQLSVISVDSPELPASLAKGFRIVGSVKRGRTACPRNINPWFPVKKVLRTETVPPVIVLGRANVNLLGHVRALGICGIPVYSILFRDESPEIVRRCRYAADVFDMRNNTEREIASTIVSLAAMSNERPVLMPAGDPEVSFVFRNWAILRDHVKISWDPELCHHYSDKELQLDLVSKAGIRIPRSCSLSAPEDLENIKGYSFPVICKPVELARKGIFPGKLLIFQTYEELYKKISPILGWKGGLLIVQEYIPGDIQNIYFCIADCDESGEMKFAVTGKKLRDNTRGGMGIGQTTSIGDLEDHARQVFRSFGVGGVLGVEFKKHQETGELYYIESNFRPENFHSIAPAAGVNVLLSNYLRAIGYPDFYEPLPQRQVRWMDFSLVVLGWLGKRGEFKKLGRFRFFDSVPTVDALWRRDDLMPGVVWYMTKSLALVRKILKGVRRRFGTKNEK